MCLIKKRDIYNYKLRLDHIISHEFSMHLFIKIVFLLLFILNFKISIKLLLFIYFLNCKFFFLFTQAYRCDLEYQAPYSPICLTQTVGCSKFTQIKPSFKCSSHATFVSKNASCFSFKSNQKKEPKKKTALFYPSHSHCFYHSIPSFRFSYVCVLFNSFFYITMSKYIESTCAP